MVRASIPCPRQLQYVPCTQHGTLGERIQQRAFLDRRAPGFPSRPRGPQQQYLQMGIFCGLVYPSIKRFEHISKRQGSPQCFRQTQPRSRCAVASLYAVLGTQPTCGVGWVGTAVHSRCTPGERQTLPKHGKRKLRR